jgi:hypothetical protein
LLATLVELEATYWQSTVVRIDGGHVVGIGDDVRQTRWSTEPSVVHANAADETRSCGSQDFLQARDIAKGREALEPGTIEGIDRDANLPPPAIQRRPLIDIASRCSTGGDEVTA